MTEPGTWADPPRAQKADRTLELDAEVLMMKQYPGRWRCVGRDPGNTSKRDQFVRRGCEVQTSKEGDYTVTYARWPQGEAGNDGDGAGTGSGRARGAVPGGGAGERDVR